MTNQRNKFFEMTADELVKYSSNLEMMYTESAEFHEKKLKEWLQKNPGAAPEDEDYEEEDRRP